MSRSRPKTSRFLLIFLALAVAIGVFVFAFRHRQNRAMAAADNPGPALPAPADNGPAPAVTATPNPDEADAVITRAPGQGVATTVTPTAPATTAAPTAAKPQAATTPAKPQAALAEVVLSSKPLVDAKAKVEAGKLLDARDIYNAVITGGKHSADEVRAAKRELSALNEKIVFSRELVAGDRWAEEFRMPPGGVLAASARRYAMTPELLLRVNGISNARRIQANQKLKMLKGPLHAVVDKSDFTLDVYFGAPGGPGSSYLTTFRVGLGKDDSTPTGKWMVEPNKKLANPTYYSPRGEGVIGPDDPKNPLGEYWIALAGIEGQAVGKESYGIHGTIEPESIGTMASMGCIRLKAEDIEQVFTMLVEGKSTVVVVE